MWAEWWSSNSLSSLLRTFRSVNPQCCCCNFSCSWHRFNSYQSSSTGYLPVRQAVQWPTLLLDLLLELITLSFWWEVIPCWTADTKPSTVRYCTLSAPTQAGYMLAEVHQTGCEAHGKAVKISEKTTHTEHGRCTHQCIQQYPETRACWQWAPPWLECWCPCSKGTWWVERQPWCGPVKE